jgi:hypothetical protein
MHLSGVTAEDKPGAKKQPMRRLNSSVSGPDSGFRSVELAKGFEPPTL